ncbi:MAG TPA: hypothetical protein DHW14_00295 [Clostridiales bacterium]|nr:hypothetical protein [Clostridiales bacterium]
MTPGGGYLSGANIFRDALVEVVRPLPFGGDVLVREGQVVDPDTVVAHLNPSGYLHFVNVARELDVPFHMAAGCVVKAEGEAVRRGEVLACRPAALGLVLAECRSPADGIVERIYPSGLVTVRAYPIPVTAWVGGRVLEAGTSGRVVILTKGTLIQGVFGLGGERHGRLFVLPNNRPPPGGLPAGGVVVSPGPAGRDLLDACLAGRAAALVAPTCHLRDLEALGWDPGRPDSEASKRNLSLVLVLTEGFGEQEMSTPLYEALAEREGLVASVSGHTQLRAGVLRPEVIVPSGGPPASRPVGPAPLRVGRRTAVYLDRNCGPPRLRVGSAVRVIRGAHEGSRAVVVELPPHPRQVASGAVLPVVVVRLEDGRIVTVARANVAATEGTAAGETAGHGGEDR